MTENGWLGFVNIDLSSKDKAEVKKTEITEAGLLDWIAERAAAGYRFSLSHDRERDCFVASLTCKAEDDVNHGLTMSQRHSQPLIALRALWFVHEVKADGNWNVGNRQDRLRFAW